MRRLFLWLVLGLVLVSWGSVSPGYAQSSPSQEESAAAPDPHLREQVAKLEGQVEEAQSAGDNAWLLVCSALVLMMTGPGLALFYGGLVRKKNVLATMMQSFTLMALITVLWALFGYSLAFDSGTVFMGGLDHLFLRGVGAQPDPAYVGTIPAQTFMVFQLLFAIITPALITGAFAERMKFSAMVAFMILCSIIVYDPMAHMVWGKGGLLNAAGGGRFPTLDFAGGTVGALLTGVFATSMINPIFSDSQGNSVAVGLPEGNAGQLINQFVGVIIAWVLAIVGTLVILKVVDAAIGLRVSEEHEIQGLDLSQHGEEGYNLEA